jgi:hypothetical protein
VYTGNLLVDAQTAFSRESRRRRRDGVIRWVLRRPADSNRLVSLDQLIGREPPATGRQAGVRPIPLESIVGTVEPSKARSFDRRFRPPRSSRGRWERLWIAARRGAPLPPISVFQLGERYFVSDGHHRVSVAQALGMHAIDGEVTVIGA